MSPATLKRVAIALVVVLVLWGAAELLGGRSDRLEAVALLEPPPRDATDSVSFARSADTVRLVRAQDSWSVNGFAAAPTAIDELFEALHDSAQAELVARSPSSHGRMGVDTTGTRMRVVSAGRTMVDLVFGNEGPAYRTRYVRPEGDERVYLLRGRLAEFATRSVNDWRNKRITAIPADSIARLAIERGRRRYTLVRGDSAWTFADGSPTDTAAVRRAIGQFATLDAQGGSAPFATPADVDSADFRRPDRRVTLLDSAGDTLAALLFDSTATGFWVRHDSGGTVFHLPRWRTDDVTPADSTLRPRGESD